jgi:hypothetical protein
MGEAFEYVIVVELRCIVFDWVNSLTRELSIEVGCVNIRTEFGHEGGFHSPSRQQLPVYFLEPRVICDISCSDVAQPFVWILAQ